MTGKSQGSGERGDGDGVVARRYVAQRRVSRVSRAPRENVARICTDSIISLRAPMQQTQSTYDILSSLVSTGPYTTHRRSTQHAIRCASPRQTIGSIARASHGWACTRHHMLRRCCDSRHDKCITSHTALRNRAVGTAAITAHRPHKLTEGVQHHRRRLPTPPRSTADALRSTRAFRPAPLSGGLVSAGVLPLASLACIGEDVPPLGGVDGLSVVYGVSGWKRRSSSSRSCEHTHAPTVSVPRAPHAHACVRPCLAGPPLPIMHTGVRTSRRS